MIGLSDILTAIQNGVVALNDLGKQVFGSFNNISSQLTTNAANTAANAAAITALQAAPAIVAGPWTVWTPTPIAQTGTFTLATATGGYFAIGKLVHFSVSITITTVGTAANGITIALPPLGTVKRHATVVANEVAVIGFVGYGRMLATGTDISSILKYDNTSFITAGAVIVLTGIYELT